MVSAPTSLTLEGRPLVDRLLDDQRRLTAVERFSQQHDGDGLAPAQQQYYRDLIPLSTPQPGEQYAFEVDLDVCSGCKACVTACHSLNGLDEDETWRQVGLLTGGDADHPVLQHVTTACHHCIEPACLEGCPVLAYEKDPVTGIVHHLDDQCIGCQYCVLKCPYDVPKFNKRQGIVRKCDMCHDRLAVDEAPACVQACPNRAIRINVVRQEQVVEDSESNVFLPGAPEPSYTLPTTNFRTERALPRNMLPADYHRVTPQPAHVPLVVMLVLTQLSVGAFLVERCLDAWLAPATLASAEASASLSPSPPLPFSPSSLPGELQGAGVRGILALTAFGLGAIALLASTLHLGRPLYAFRAVVGLRRSWLSREIVAFGVFAKLAAAYAVCSFFFHDRIGKTLMTGLGSAVVLCGLGAVYCSAMIYHDTRRDFWRLPVGGTKFLLTTLLLGLSTTLLVTLVAAGVSASLTLPDVMTGWGRGVCFLLAAVSVTKLAFEALIFRHLRDKQHTPRRRTATLLATTLKKPLLVRMAAGAAGGVLLPVFAAAADLTGPAAATATPFAAGAMVGAFLLTLAGELLERFLFFTAVVAPRMPGQPAS